MSGKPDASGVSRREFIAGAGGVAAAGYLVVGGDTASAQSTSPVKTWAVAIDATKTPHFGYSEPSLGSTSADPLPVNGGDIVTWGISLPNHRRHTVIFFKEETPFLDTNRKPVWWFHGSESDEPIGGKGVCIDPNAFPGDEFPYTVIVFDEDANHIYLDDPKILIATKLLGEKQAREDVITARHKIKKASKELDEALGRLESAERNLEQVKNNKRD